MYAAGSAYICHHTALLGLRRRDSIGMPQLVLSVRGKVLNVVIDCHAQETSTVLTQLLRSRLIDRSR